MAKSRLIFFGNERLATGVTTTAPTLQALIRSGYDIAAVVSNYKPARSRTTRALEVEAVAAAHHIPLLLPAKLSDIADQLHQFQANAAILIAYGKIIPQSIIDLFPHGIINLHPSLLPLHRGPVPIEQIILDAATETGVSLMRLSPVMDAGPTFAQQAIRLSGAETKQQLADQLLLAGRDLLLQHLPAILSGELTPTPQDDSQATYDQLINKTDGLMDWSKPATRLEREVRAYLGWPGSRATILDADVIVTAAHVAPNYISGPPAAPGTAFRTPSRELAVQTAQGTLIIDHLKPVGKREMTGPEFLAGHQHS